MLFNHCTTHPEAVDGKQKVLNRLIQPVCKDDQHLKRKIKEKLSSLMHEKASLGQHE